MPEISFDYSTSPIGIDHTSDRLFGTDYQWIVLRSPETTTQFTTITQGTPSVEDDEHFNISYWDQVHDQASAGPDAYFPTSSSIFSMAVKFGDVQHWGFREIRSVPGEFPAIADYVLPRYATEAQYSAARQRYNDAIVQFYLGIDAAAVQSAEIFYGSTMVGTATLPSPSTGAFADYLGFFGQQLLDSPFDDKIDLTDFTDTVFLSGGADTLKTLGGDDVILTDLNSLGEGEEINGGLGHDHLFIDAAPSDITLETILGSSWETTSTHLLSNAGIIGILTDVEQVVFSTPTNNPVRMSSVAGSSSLTLEMATLALEAYSLHADPARDQPSSAEARGWRPLSALELGLKPSSFGAGLFGAYKFLGGVFEHDSGPGGPAGAAVVLTGVIEGKRTLVVAFRGTDGAILPDAIGSWPDFKATYQEFFSTLMDSVALYASSEDIDQVFLTGHSMGAALAETALDTHFSDNPNAFAFGFANPGSTVTGPADWEARMWNLNRVGDLVPPAGQLVGYTAPGTTHTLYTGLYANPLTAHDMTGYLADIKNLVSAAFNPANLGFYNSVFALELRAGAALPPQDSAAISLGNRGRNSLVAFSDTRFVVAESGADTVFQLAANPKLIVSGGDGYDVVTLASTVGFQVEQVPSGFILRDADGSIIGKYYGVELVLSLGRLYFSSGERPNVQIPTSETARLAFAASQVFYIDDAYDAADAGDGDMRVIGTAGDDILYCGAGNKVVNLGAGSDVALVRRGAAYDKIILNGGAGADVMVGGDGLDVFLVDNAGDVVLGKGGIDEVQSSVSFVLGSDLENLALSGLAREGVGNALPNQLIGNLRANLLIGEAGDDILNGGAGSDELRGGGGNDVYFVGDPRDVAIEEEGQGHDLVRSSVSHSLGEHIEDLALIGSAIVGIGNRLNNAITGNSGANDLSGLAGNDILNGLAGADTMRGGRGNDVYLVDNLEDNTKELASEGLDHVFSMRTFSLSPNVENLTLDGSARSNGTGNGLSNSLAGNSAINVLRGGGGNDLLSGGGGNDTLQGGSGSDRFYFGHALNSIANVDTILDFSMRDDSIYISRGVFSGIPNAGRLSAASFHSGPTAHDAQDRIIYDQASGEIFYDRDGSGAAAPILFARVDPGTQLTYSDFIVFGA